jgi:hypothetical protein
MAIQGERPVANTADYRRFDDWCFQWVEDLAATLPHDDDRKRFYESVMRAGLWTMYRDVGYWATSEWVDGLDEAVKAQWKEDCDAKKAAKEPATSRAE